MVNTALFSDSLTAIKMIEKSSSKGSRYDIIIQIRDSHKILKESGVNIELVWIPSHVGIKGNDEADSLAKEGANSLVIDLVTKLGRTEIKALLKAKAKEAWSEEYKTSVKSIPFRNIIKTVQSGNYVTNKLNERKTRLILNNGRFRFLRKHCETCDSVNNNEHVLLYCLEHHYERKKAQRRI